VKEASGDVLFALECRVIELAGEWPPDGPARVPTDWWTRSPVVAAAYGRKRMDEGGYAEARAALSTAVRGFGRLGETGPMRAAIAWLACLDLRLGETGEAAVGLRFLSEEIWDGEEAAGGRADSAFALGFGGYAIGWNTRQRLLHLEEAVYAFVDEDRPERASSAVFAWKRLAGAAAPEAAGFDARAAAMQRRLAQKALWNEAYGWHAEAFGRGRIRPEAPLGAYERLTARAAALRAKLLEGGEPGDVREAEALAEELASRFPGAVEHRMERLLLTAAARARRGDRGGAEAELLEAEALFELGLPPEYRPAIELAAVAVRAGGGASDAPASEPVEETGPAPVRIRCFGGLRIERQGALVPEPKWKRKKAEELFIFLLLRPGHAAPKEQVLDALFPDAEPSKASNQLYVAIYEVNRALKESCGWEDGAALRDGVVALPEHRVEEVDVEKYTTLVRVADQLHPTQADVSEELYESAAELYGSLLPKLPYVEWLARLRDELEWKQERILERLAAGARERNETEREERFLRMRAELAPLQEPAVQELLRLYARTGRTAEAKRLFEAFERRLLAEDGERPSPETKRLADGL